MSADLYLDLMTSVLTRSVFEDSDEVIGFNHGGRSLWRRRALTLVASTLSRRGVELVRKRPYAADLRENGLDWPARAETMIGLKRMRNLRTCVESVLQDSVPGDLIETGVWRGGSVIFMRAILKAYRDDSRTVWAADSFQGLPAPDLHRYPADSGDDYSTFTELAVGVEQVKHNFRRYGLLDDQVRFLVGWFKDTLTEAPIQRLAILRLDGDMYESTIQAIEPLYPKLSPHGYCIVDDYHVVPGCKQAIHDYRKAHNISEPIQEIDGVGVFWRREARASSD